MKAARPCENPERILIRGVNWLGDAVMTTPALHRLRERFPAAHISLATPQKLQELWRRQPLVDEVIALDPSHTLFAVARKLRATRANLALVLPNSPRSALECFLAGIPRRLGYARSWRNLLLTDAVRDRPEKVRMHKKSEREIKMLVATAPHGRNDPRCISATAHQIFDYLHLVAALGANVAPLPPRLSMADEEAGALAQKFQISKVAHTIVLGVNPGAEYGPAKRWPVESFIATVRQLQARQAMTCIIFGGQGDIEIARQIEEAVRKGAPTGATVVNVAGKTTLRELMALLKRCTALLSNDTGPAHVAAALGVPVVIPFGSTSPELTGPGFPGDDRHAFLRTNPPCSPCFRRECPIDFRCMRDIQPEAAVVALSRTIG